MPLHVGPFFASLLAAELFSAFLLLLANDLKLPTLSPTNCFTKY